MHVPESQLGTETSEIDKDSEPTSKNAQIDTKETKPETNVKLAFADIELANFESVHQQNEPEIKIYRREAVFSKVETPQQPANIDNPPVLTQESQEMH